MKLINWTALFCLGAVGFAQDVRFDYDRSANFSFYKTYQWVDYKEVPIGDQLLDRDIKRAVDEQLAGKGLRRVESGGNLVAGYQTAITQEKQFDGFSWGPALWGGSQNNNVDRRYRQAGHWSVRLGSQTTGVARLGV